MILITCSPSAYDPASPAFCSLLQIAVNSEHLIISLIQASRLLGVEDVDSIRAKSSRAPSNQQEKLVRRLERGAH